MALAIIVDVLLMLFAGLIIVTGERHGKDEMAGTIAGLLVIIASVYITIVVCLQHNLCRPYAFLFFTAAIIANTAMNLLAYAGMYFASERIRNGRC